MVLFINIERLVFISIINYIIIQPFFVCVKVIKICCNFKTKKHFYKHSHVEIVDKCICTHYSFIRAKTCSVLPVVFEKSS